MRNVCLLAAALVVLGVTITRAARELPATAVTENPLIAPWTGAHGGVPPWDKLQPALFPGALERAMAEERRETDAIVANPEAPTFENTIAAMERSGGMRKRVEMLLDIARQNLSTPEYRAVEREWRPRLSAAADAIIFNTALFRRIETVHQSLQSVDLDPDQERLVARVYDQYVRRGATLGEGQKDRLSHINQEIAQLLPDFRARILADEDSWTVLEAEADLAGLPSSLVASAKAAADERKLTGKWVIVNTRSSVDPFLTFSSRRDLRERVWKKFKSRGDNGDANDTKATATRIVNLRAERAALLGFASHAHWRMADTMALDPRKAQALLMNVWPAAVGRVKEEVADMKAIAAKEGIAGAFEPWDYLYFAEKVRAARYNLNQAEIKPYFELNNMVAAAMWSAERIYGIAFSDITGRVPMFHPDVQVWEARDISTGVRLGVFYLDNFARPGKRSGAWTMRLRAQSHFDGDVTALTSNNNNFVKGAPGEPVLISLEDARTLFHEFGHVLHGLLQDIRYPGLSDPPRDFVEYPSQVYEEWLLTREVLDRFALHYQTRQPIPQALVNKIQESGKFNQGYATVESLASAIVDMELHMRPGGVSDLARFEHEVLERIGMPREVAMRHRLPHFEHLFATESYSAGYYSYLWSDVMSADTWQAFLEAGGPWDKAVAARLRKHILSEGNATDRAEAYRRFRGRNPDVKALLEERGF
jgi:peptidyl-dipeptidase Dcp